MGKVVLYLDAIFAEIFFDLKRVMLMPLLNFPCENKFPIGQLTYDHVIPVSRKGPNAWTNVVTACNYCNGKKGNKLLKDTDMKLKVQPYMPTRYELQRKARQYPPKNLHADWEDYV